MAQVDAPSEALFINASNAQTWTDGSTHVVMLDGPIKIDLDRTHLTAARAVIWLTPVANTVMGQQNVEIALLGDASLAQEQVLRTGDRLYVTATVRGNIRLTADARTAHNDDSSPVYQQALSLRPARDTGDAHGQLNRSGPTLRPSSPDEDLAGGIGARPGDFLVQRPWLVAPPATLPTTAPASQEYRPSQPITLSYDEMQTVPDAVGNVALILSGHVNVMQRRRNGDYLELLGDRAVIFTTLKSLTDLGKAKSISQPEDVIKSAYIEGDVRLTFTPQNTVKASEQRVLSDRIFYDFTTDRAVMTKAVLHTFEAKAQVPIQIRAQVMRQLSEGEYRAEGVELSTSSFVQPSYSIRASRAYVRQVDTGDPRLGVETNFVADSTTFNLFGVPVFYLPVLAGEMTERGTPLRGILFGSSRGFGFGVRTEFGLFETLGVPPPEDLDASFRLDYFAHRGAAFGLDAKYEGTFTSETTRQPWSFSGDFTGYIVPHDEDVDHLGKQRDDVKSPTDLRGHLFWEHQHFFPNDWQVQLTAGYVSDPTFLEEWFEDEFNERREHELSAYVKHQHDTEAFTLLVKANPNNFVTTSDLLQEQTTVERLPELGYHRIGDSVFDDRMTFFSDNSLAALRFDPSRASLADEGFRADQAPGIRSFAQTGGDDDNAHFRGDFRQEIDYPLAWSGIKFVPYVMGRYTGYSDSPDGDPQNRLYAGTGVRMTTAFWKTDDSAQSDLFDIHRVRHVIEPELNVYTSAASKDPDQLLIYDEDVDKTYDVSAAQLALRQRWQTKRGGPGRWRSVDFFTLNVEGNFFANQPSDTFLNPAGFRGLFYPTLPETSIPRNAINADALWRVSDSTAVLADANYNLDQNELATASVGLAVQRDTRMTYFVGTRYLGQINSTIATIAANYELSSKYSLAFSESVNLGQIDTQSSSFTVLRHFDRFSMTFTLYYDAVRSEGGFKLGLFPEGLGGGLSTDQVNQLGR